MSASIEISIRVFTISNLLDDDDVNVSIIYYNELFWLNLMKNTTSIFII